MGSMAGHSAITAANRQFIEAYHRGDASALANMYTANCHLLPRRAAIIAGKNGVRAYWQGVLDKGVKSVTLQTVKVKANHHFAMEGGEYAFLGPDSQVSDAGWYVVIWRKDRGTRLLHQGVWITSRSATEEWAHRGFPAGRWPPQ
jgi:uncharacterized protein (TIGR02246 family)